MKNRTAHTTCGWEGWTVIVKCCTVSKDKVNARGNTTSSWQPVEPKEWKQDHQRWGYIAPWLIWKNLSTWPHGKIWTERKEKNTEKRLNHRNGEDGQTFPFFSAGLRAFGAQAVRLQNVFFPILKASLTILDLGPSCTISDYIGPFQTIMDHFRPSWTILDHSEQSWIILDNIGPWHNFLAILDYVLAYS